jgi:ABC-type polysaccharide/polyol phosphate export permease
MLRDRGLPWIVDYNPFYHLLEVVRQPLLHAQAASSLNYQAVGILIVVLAMIAATFAWRYHRRLVYFL